MTSKADNECCCDIRIKSNEGPMDVLLYGYALNSDGDIKPCRERLVVDSDGYITSKKQWISADDFPELTGD